MLNQEGSLLDSEGGVGSLGADWSINVPVGKKVKLINRFVVFYAAYRCTSLLHEVHSVL